MAEEHGGFVRRSVRRARLVVAVACLLGGLASLCATGVTGRLSPGGWTPASAESVRAETLLAAEFRSGPPQLILLATTPGSVDAPRAAASGRELVRQLAADHRVAWVRGYWPSSDPGLRTGDRHRALVLVRLRGDEQAVQRTGSSLMDRFTGTAGPLRISASGEAAVWDETERLSEQGMRTAELVAVPLVLAILLWALGSVTAALLPLAVGLLSVAVTTAFLRLLSGTTMVSLFALNITTALGFGLAVDYSLLLVNRYREESAAAGTPEQALGRTLRSAGRAVAFSAATISASLGTLLFFPLPLLKSLAYGGAAVACASAVAALTVLPALLVLLGDRIDRYDVFARFRRREPAVSSGAWFRLARWVMRRPVRVAAGVLALLVLLAVAVTQVRFGMYDDRVLPRSSPVAEASRELRAAFGSEVVDATTVVLPGLSAGRSAPRLDAYARRLSLVPGVRLVSTATGSYRDGQRAAGPDAGSGQFAGPGGSWLSLTSSVANPLSPAGSRLAERIRAVPPPGPALVGGPGAGLADTEHLLSSRLPAAAGVLVLVVFVLLLAFTRSVLIPVKALVLNGLSLLATAGVLVAVFQEGHLAFLLGDVTASGITDVVVPSLMFCVAFGLSMDYEVFLLSRIVEEHRRGQDTGTAVAVGMQRSGRLFTSAALVFAVVMAALALSPLILLKVVGAGLALAVLLDCTLVRALLVPAVMALAGRANWWAPRLRPGRRLRRGRRLRPGRRPDPTTAGASAPAAPMEAP